MQQSLPNYKDGSIVNLMSTIARARGGKTQYNELKLLSSKEIKDSKNIILIILDGLGYDYMQSKRKPFLKDNCIGKITSVFPPTTASAITTFATGDAPMQHAYTGWFVHLKEIGMVTSILPFKPRIGGEEFSKHEIKIEEILKSRPITEKMKTKLYTIITNDLVNSDFTKYANKKSKVIGYKTINGFFNSIKKSANESGKKYIYAYWPYLDKINHKYGCESRKSEAHYKKISRRIKKLIDELKNTNSTVIITADHGFIDSPNDKCLMLKDHPKLKECLSLPFSGEPRVVYCYIRTSKIKQFEQYVKTKLKKYCQMYKSEELIKKGWYGLFKENPQLYERIGDYVLIMKENYTFKDNILNQKRHYYLGNHGGVSSKEMNVPLIVIKI